eukprot:scaffold15674_cov148-Skeletonema_marinoi.AAC.2
MTPVTVIITAQDDNEIYLKFNSICTLQHCITAIERQRRMQKDDCASSCPWIVTTNTSKAS